MITAAFAFLVTIAVLIVVHEYGHYRVAVACGVKVLRFSVGFGRVVWRRQRTPEATEFVVSALPLGGYVRMLDEREGPVAAEELDRAFNRQPLARRTAIVAAGPLANLLLAVLLYAAANWIGVDEVKAVIGTPVSASIAEQAGLQAGDWVQQQSADGATWDEVRSMTDLRWAITQAALHRQPLQLRVTDAQGHRPRVVTLDLGRADVGEVDAQLMQRVGISGPFNPPLIGQVNPGGAAARAGLREGDLVLAIDGAAVSDGAKLRETIRANAIGGRAKTMHWQVERAGQRVDIDVEPAVVEDGGRRVGRIDAYVGGPPAMVNVRYGLVDGLVQGLTRTWEMSALTLRMIGRMLIGQASLSNLSGPLTIADYAGQSVQLGLAYYLGFLALVSVSLGVLNLLPLPMLDGGHLMYYLFEAATGRPVSAAWLERLQRGGVAVLLLMMSLALYNDVARLLGLH